MNNEYLKSYNKINRNRHQGRHNAIRRQHLSDARKRTISYLKREYNKMPESGMKIRMKYIIQYLESDC